MARRQYGSVQAPGFQRTLTCTGDCHPGQLHHKLLQHRTQIWYTGNNTSAASKGRRPTAKRQDGVVQWGSTFHDATLETSDFKYSGKAPLPAQRVNDTAWVPWLQVHRRQLSTKLGRAGLHRVLL